MIGAHQYYQERFFLCKNALVSPGQIRFTHEEMNMKIFISISAVRRHFINFILYSFMRGARRGTMRFVYASFSSQDTNVHQSLAI